jgi:uncharacterized RmlC-like cupin family protein
MGYAAGDIVAAETEKWLPNQPCSAVIARTDPNEQESVIPLPELKV